MEPLIESDIGFQFFANLCFVSIFTNHMQSMFEVRIRIIAARLVILDCLHEMLFCFLAILIVARSEGDDFSQVKLGTRIVCSKTYGFIEVVASHCKKVVINCNDSVVALERCHNWVEFAAGPLEPGSLELSLDRRLQSAGKQLL